MIQLDNLASYRRLPYLWLIVLIAILALTIICIANKHDGYAQALIQGLPTFIVMVLMIDATRIGLEKDANQSAAGVSTAARIRDLKLELEELQLKFEIETQRNRLAALRQSAPAEGNTGDK